MFYQQFYLLKDLSKDQINATLSKNNLHCYLKPSDIKIFPEVNSNNFINVCNFADYYQLIDDYEFLENIRLHILNKNPIVINNLDKLSCPMQNKICNHECFTNMKCKYNGNYLDNIKHISCYKFLSQNRNIRYGVEDASRNGNLEIIKYFFKIGKNCNTFAIDLASSHGHLHVVKYLFEVQHKKGTPFAITWASQNGYLEIVKYLFEVQHNIYCYGSLDWAIEKGHLEVVKYLFEVAHKNCTANAINRARQNGYLEVTKYLTEVQKK